MPRSRPTLRHEAFLYRDAHEYVAGVGVFVAASMEADRPVLVAVPGDHAGVIADWIGQHDGGVQFLDMTELGRNPGRIIPAVQAFVDRHPEREKSVVGEPIWPGRSHAEVAEVTRHEALINRALASTALHVLCPYQVTALSGTVLSDAYRTHPVVQRDGRHRLSSTFADPEEVWRSVGELPPTPPHARRLAFDAAGLSTVRDAVQATATRAGIAPNRIEDLVVATSEIAGNSIRHAGGSGALQTWTESDAAVCQVHDHGVLIDPLAGQRRPDPLSERGWGLWLANQLCDLVQLHSDGGGTSVRLRVRR